jgi:hypothetical protein
MVRFRPEEAPDAGRARGAVVRPAPERRARLMLSRAAIINSSSIDRIKGLQRESRPVGPKLLQHDAGLQCQVADTIFARQASVAEIPLFNLPIGLYSASMNLELAGEVITKCRWSDYGFRPEPKHERLAQRLRILARASPSL